MGRVRLREIGEAVRERVMSVRERRERESGEGVREW